MGILQARILDWVAISLSRDLPNPGIEQCRSTTLQVDSLSFEPCLLTLGDLPNFFVPQFPHLQNTPSSFILSQRLVLRIKELIYKI